MRLKSLHLERYGHFTNKELLFREGACLHLVHGANEAGKSCSLAAVTDLFFKFEPKSEWDFLHPGQLSVGATIVGSDGTTLSFARRKGTKYTLLGSAGEAIPEDSLDPYLGSLTRETFSRAFGLSAKGLRRGAKEMLKSGGEVGASLIAAASGLRGLNELRTRLANEASAIFMPTKAQSRTFYQALKRHEDAVAEIRKRELRESELKRRLALIEELTAKLEAARAARHEDLVRRENLEHFSEVVPLLNAITLHARVLEQWRHLAPLSESELARIKAAHAAKTHAESELQRLQSEYAEAQLYAEGVTLDAALLAEDALIQSLKAQTGAYTEKKGQLGGVRAEGDRVRRELAGLRLRLGLAAETDLAGLQPTDAVTTTVQRLLQEGRTLQQARNTLTSELEKQRAEAARLQRKRAASGAAEDPGPLRVQLQRLMPVLGRLEASEIFAQRLADDKRRLTDAGRALLPAVNDLDALSAVTLPADAIVRQFATDWEDTRRQRQPLQDRLRSATERAGEGKSRRVQFEARSPIASPERILEQRNLRESLWTGIRRILFEEETRPGFSALADMVSGYELSIASADQLADRAVLQADRLAEYQANEKQIIGDEEEQTNVTADIERLSDAQTGLQQRWQAIWQPVGIVALDPAEMLPWLTEVKRLLERSRELLGDASKVRNFEDELAQIRPLLDALLAELGFDGSSHLTPRLAVSAADAALELLERNWREATELLVLERENGDQKEVLALETAALESKHVAWQTSWNNLLPALHQAPGTGCDEVEAVLAVWKTLPDKLEALANNDRRVNGMQRDMKTFADQTSELLGRMGEAFPGVEPDAVILLLAARLSKANEQQSTYKEAGRNLEILKGKAVLASTAATLAIDDLNRLAEQLPREEDPSILISQLERRAQTQKELDSKRETLESLARNKSETELREALGNWDATGSSAEIARLRQAEQQHALDENKAYSTLHDAQRELESLESGTGAELALQQKRNAEAELLEQTRTWAVKRLGHILLTHVVDHHRNRQEQPLLRRASELFSLLTAGSFSAIEQERDSDSDSEKASLVGRRDAVRTVCVPSMSTGTRDQLYLALRLAYLEQYAANTEPVPFIGDDLFTSSDERRTAKGLQALAATGSIIQPILFTHHQHVVDLACAELGTGVDVITL